MVTLLLNVEKSQCLCRFGVHKCQFRVLKHVSASSPPGVLSVCLCVYKHTLSHTHNVVNMLELWLFPKCCGTGRRSGQCVFPSMNYAWHSKQLWWIIPRACVSVFVCLWLCVCVCSYLCTIWRTKGINNAICDEILCKHNKTGSLNHVSCHRHGHLFPVLVPYCLEKRSIYSKLRLRLSNHKSQMLLSFLHWFQVLFHSFSHIFLVSV